MAGFVQAGDRIQSSVEFSPTQRELVTPPKAYWTAPEWVQPLIQVVPSQAWKSSDSKTAGGAPAEKSAWVATSSQ